MEKKKLTKYLWHGSDIDAEGNPIIPEAAPEGEHILGLNEGEIYIHNHPENPTLYTLSSNGKVVSVGGNTDMLDKRYLRKDKDDRSKGKISSDKGFEVGKFEQGTLGTGASMYEGEDKNTYIEADFLKIRKKATFTTISVQELKHVGGEIILSPAAMICSKVEETELGYKCYFNTEDSDGRKIYNEFEAGDFARCQTFNLEYNKYYWRYVSEVGKDYIVLSKFDCDSNSDIPEAGDNISQLGNRYDEERQNAIVLSAYGPDAPSYKQYNGINGYALSEGMLVTKLSPKGNMLKGDFISQSTGKNIEQEFEKVKVDWDKVLSQTDKEFTMWFYEYEPTLDNIPASEWNTDELKALHEQDLFYDLSTGYAYRFEFVEGEYKWNIVTDGETIKALEKAAKAQEAADKVKENLEEIVSDGILSALEKKEVLKEWNTIVSVYPRNIETANKHGLSTSAYTNAYMMLGQYLNGGNAWDGQSIPLWLSETDKNQEIDPESYRGYWTDYYDAESEILDAVTGDVDKKADEKKRVFVSQPTPPYDEGDMWVNATYGEYKNDCLVCIRRRIQGDLFFISDWRPVSSVTNKVKESIEENIKNLAESAGGNEVYTQDDNPWNSWESGTEWKHVGAIWHCTRNVINTITKEIIYYEGHTYRYYGYDNTDLWEDITNLVYTSSYFMRNEKQIAGVVGAYDENGELKEDSGFVVTSNFAEIFSANKEVQAAVQVSVNKGFSNATIQADKINFKGKTIINGNFTVDNDGNLQVKADISANTLSLLTKTYGGSMSDYSLGYGSGSFTLPRIDNSNGQLFREVKFLSPNNTRAALDVTTVSVYDSGSETILYQDEDGIIKNSSSVSLNVNTLYTFTAIPIESSWFSAEYIWYVSSQELAKL